MYTDQVLDAVVADVVYIYVVMMYMPSSFDEWGVILIARMICS